jgi:hypothetical protein
MTLLDIEHSIRPNFVWDKEPHRRWFTDKKIEGDVTLGMTMFAGVSRFHGFREKDVLKHTGMTKSQYTSSVARFKRQLAEYQAYESNHFEAFEPAKRFHNKLLLIQNHIKLNHQGREYISLADLEF